MTPFFEQLTHDLTALERELIRMRRELIRFQHAGDEWRVPGAPSPVSEIAAMDLPIGEWDEMEREIHG